MPIRRGHVAPRTTIIETIIRKFDTHDRSFLVINAQQGLSHVIYCSDGFCRLTGFSRAEVMQRSAVCEFLHGPMTSEHAISALRDALMTGDEKHFEILYYRKDGTKFLCSEVIALIKSEVDDICLQIINFEDLSVQSSHSPSITTASQTNTKLSTRFIKVKASFKAGLSKTGVVSSSQQSNDQPESTSTLSHPLNPIVLDEDISEKSPLTTQNICIMDSWNMNKMKNEITPTSFFNNTTTAIGASRIAKNTFLIQSNIASFKTNASITNSEGINDVSQRSNLWEQSHSPAVSESIGEYSHATSLETVSQNYGNNLKSKLTYHNLTCSISTKHSKIFPDTTTDSDLQKWRISKDRKSPSLNQVEPDSIKDKVRKHVNQLHISA